MAHLSTIHLPDFDAASIRHLEQIVASFRHWTGQPLVATAETGHDLLQKIFATDFALLAHGDEPDPLINFVNTKAMQLWEMTWPEFIGMPSRLTAEIDQRDDRARVLRDVQQQGYSNGYSGIRISRTGRRFRIHEAMVWNVLNDQHLHIGQAAMFRSWTFL